MKYSKCFYHIRKLDAHCFIVAKLKDNELWLVQSTTCCIQRGHREVTVYPSSHNWTVWKWSSTDGYIVGSGEEVLWRGCEGVARQQGGQLGVMSAGLRSCLLSVPGPDKNRQAGLGRPAWSCHHGHLLTAIITSAPASHRYSIQTQLRALHVPLQPAITNTPASLTRLPVFPLANL